MEMKFMMIQFNHLNIKTYKSRLGQYYVQI